jgi:hypothetical protein
VSKTPKRLHSNKADDGIPSNITLDSIKGSILSDLVSIIREEIQKGLSTRIPQVTKTDEAFIEDPENSITGSSVESMLFESSSAVGESEGKQISYLSSIPMGAVVPENIKVWERNYIDLSALLNNSDDEESFILQWHPKQNLFVRAPKSKAIQNFDQWLKAFLIFASLF